MNITTTNGLRPRMLVAALATAVLAAGIGEAAAADKCAGIRRRAQAQTKRALRKCDTRAAKTVARGGVPEGLGCTLARWAAFDRYMAKRGCFGRPLLAVTRATAASPEDLAVADADATAKQAAVRNVIAKIRAAIAALPPEADDRTIFVAVQRYQRPLVAAGEELADAEALLGQVEQALWGSYETAWKVPSHVGEPLAAAMTQLQIELRRIMGPSLRTDVRGIARLAGCRIDLVADRPIERYGRAIVDATAGATAVAALGDLATGLACLSNAQASLFDIALVTAYERVVSRLEAAGLAPVVGALARIVAPVELLVLDTVKHKGEGAYAWRWFVANRGRLAEQVQRLGWATGDVVWLYDRLDGSLAGFPRCGTAGRGVCVDHLTLLRSAADPRALGLGDCALAGMVARGPRPLGDDDVYACPSLECAAGSPTRAPGAIGALPVGTRGPLGGMAGRLPWSNLSTGDLAAMRGLCESGPAGGAGGSTQGPGALLGDHGGTKSCIAGALDEAGGPFERYARCVIDSADTSAVPTLGTDHQGAPLDPKCGLMEEGSTTPPAESAPAEDDDDADLASKIWNAVKALLDEVTQNGKSGAGAVVDAEVKLLDPENAQQVYDTAGALVRANIERRYAAGDLSEGEYRTLMKMKPGDAAEYLKHKNGSGFRDCASAEECDPSCTAVNTQIAERQACERAFIDETVGQGDDLDPLDPVINPSPDAPGEGPGGLTACVLDEGGTGGRANLECGVVTCTDGPATAFAGQQCCVDAGSTAALPVDRVGESLCEKSMCGDGNAAVLDGGGSCGCVSVPQSAGGDGPAPAPGPRPSPVDRAGIR